MKTLFIILLLSFSGCSIIERTYNHSVWVSDNGMTTEELQKLFQEYNLKYFDGKLCCNVHWFVSDTLNGQMCPLIWSHDIFIEKSLTMNDIPHVLLHEMCHAKGPYTLKYGGHNKNFCDEVRRVSKLSGIPANIIYHRIDDIDFSK